MEYSREETEEWLRTGKLPDKSSKIKIRNFRFDDVTLYIDQNLKATIESNKSVEVKLLSFKFEQQVTKENTVTQLKFAYQQGKQVIRITKEICE